MSIGPKVPPKFWVPKILYSLWYLHLFLQSGPRQQVVTSLWQEERGEICWPAFQHQTASPAPRWLFFLKLYTIFDIYVGLSFFCILSLASQHEISYFSLTLFETWKLCTQKCINLRQNKSCLTDLKKYTLCIEFHIVFEITHCGHVIEKQKVSGEDWLTDWTG